MKKNQNGFSLIELIIVVVIIGIISAIAIPNLLASRRTANEASAVSSLRLFHSSQVAYQSTIGGGNFAGDETDPAVAFTELRANGFIDVVLATRTKNGFTFSGYVIDRSATDTAQCVGIAIPIVDSGVMATGDRSFAIITDGVIYSGVPAGFSVTTVSGSFVVGGGSPLAN